MHRMPWGSSSTGQRHDEFHEIVAARPAVDRALHERPAGAGIASGAADDSAGRFFARPSAAQPEQRAVLELQYLEIEVRQTEAVRAELADRASVGRVDELAVRQDLLVTGAGHRALAAVHGERRPARRRADVAHAPRAGADRGRPADERQPAPQQRSAPRRARTLRTTLHVETSLHAGVRNPVAMSRLAM